jgi:predicted permease
MTATWLRLKALVKRRQLDRDLEEELRFHLAMRAEKYEAGGMSPDEARYTTHRRFGNATSLKEVCREMWTFTSWEAFWQDLRYGARMLRKNPGFTLVCVLTLALGIGANTAIFGFVNAVLLRPLPFPEPDQLVRIYSTKGGAEIPTSPLDARDIAAESHTLESTALYAVWPKNVSGLPFAADPEQGYVGMVQSGWFDLLRIRPILGRLFTPDEDQPGRHYVVALSEGYWRSRFGADPHVLGQLMRINDEGYSIVAVVPDAVPSWVTASASVSLWTPFVPYAGLWEESNRGNRGFSLIGRMKPGVSLGQARADLGTVAASLAARYPADRGISAAVHPLIEMRVGSARPVLMMLLGAVGLTLLIACANLANLLLARNASRHREIAVRAAIGAGRRALVRMLLAESLALSIAGGGLGVLVASLASAALVRFHPRRLPQLASTTLDWRVLLFTFAVSLLAAVLFGVLPALAGTRVNLVDALRSGGRSGMGGAGLQRLRRALVVSEMALSLMLMIGAGLLVRSILNIQNQDQGFRTERLLTAHFYLPPARYPQGGGAITRFTDEFSQRLRALPGVQEATIAAFFPPTGGWEEMFTVDRHPATSIDAVPEARLNTVDWRYRATLGIPLVRGRDFTESDTEATRPVALINQTLARRFFSGEDPVGQQMHLGPPESVLRPSESGHPYTQFVVVGVIGDTRNRGLALSPEPEITALFRQTPDLNNGFKRLMIRTAVDPHGLDTALRRELRSLDPDVPITDIRTMNEILSEQASDTRFTTLLLGALAALGVLLAIIGVYGVVSYLIVQRTHEIGVRLALGANRKDIVWMILRQGLLMALLGSGCGLLGAFAAQHSIAGLLYGISALDPLTFSAAALLMLLIAVLACTIPARRASRIQPMFALRDE